MQKNVGSSMNDLTGLLGSQHATFDARQIQLHRGHNHTTGEDAIYTHNSHDTHKSQLQARDASQHGELHRGRRTTTTSGDTRRQLEHIHALHLSAYDPARIAYDPEQMADRIAKVPDLYPTAEEPPLAEPALQQPKVAAPVAGAAILGWRSLTVTVKKNGAQILKNVQGVISGGFTAVMGPSGCGKSSLLNTLALRLDKAVAQTGDIRLNGCAYTRRQLKLCSGYVMQDDLLNGTFTVLETLDFTARLKLPPTISVAERTLRIEQVSKAMGLAHILHVNVGDPLHKGISGGERKRLCVAMELLTKPALLFLDEPTSGLDSVTALSLVRSLRALSDSGACTIVCTIHQPQAKIFALFDNLLLLKAGVIMYQGPAGGALAAFAEVGYPCPDSENPANHFLDVITPPSELNSNNVSISAEAEAKLIERFGIVEVDLRAGISRPLRSTRVFLPWTQQTYVLFVRSMHELLRRRDMMATQLCQTLAMALVVGMLFYQIGDTQTSIEMRMPVLCFITNNQGMFGAMMIVNSFPAERMLSLRERASGSYNASAYFLAKTTAETIMTAVYPIIFAVIVYLLIGFQLVASKLFLFVWFVLLAHLAATSLALAVSSIARITDYAVIIVSLLLEISRLFGGFYLSPKQLPKYFSFIDAVSYVKYVYTAIGLNELDGLKLVCTPSELDPIDGSCPVTSGQQTIDKLGLNYISIGGCFGVLLIYIVFVRAIAYLGLRYVKN